MNWKKHFYPDLADATLEKTKLSSFWLLIVTCLFFLSFIGTCIYDSWNEIPVTVKVTGGFEKSTTHQLSNSISFENTSEGLLSISGLSFFERMLFHKVENKNIIDYICFLLIGIILFGSIRSVNDKNIFSEKISKCFNLIGFLFISMFIISGFFEILVVRKLILIKTNQAYSAIRVEGKMDYLIFGAIILLFVYFSKQGTFLQKEQGYTDGYFSAYKS